MWGPPAGEARICECGAEVVRQLKRVQDALGSGYLSAFPEEHFDRLEALQPVWAPYYVVMSCLMIVFTPTRALRCAVSAPYAQAC